MLNGVIQMANELFYNMDLNGYRSFQYTTYDAEREGKYDWHMDTHLGQLTYPQDGTRKLSLTLTLNDDFEGGQFLINEGNQNNATVVPATKGRCILFPSYMCHKVTPVTKGVRKSLVIWVTGPKFR